MFKAISKKACHTIGQNPHLINLSECHYLRGSSSHHCTNSHHPPRFPSIKDKAIITSAQWHWHVNGKNDGMKCLQAQVGNVYRTIPDSLNERILPHHAPFHSPTRQWFDLLFLRYQTYNFTTWYVMYHSIYLTFYNSTVSYPLRPAPSPLCIFFRGYMSYMAGGCQW